MTGTRSSARNAGNNPSPARSDDAVAGTKRKPEAELSPKRNRKVTKKQTTLEETGILRDSDSEMKDAKASDHNDRDKVEFNESDNSSESKDGEPGSAPNAETPASEVNEEADDAQPELTNEAAKSDSNDNGAIGKTSQRERDMPSNVLEKGVIYFFTRNRVGVDDADSVGDLQRTFFVLRPLPVDTKLGEGAIPDLGNNRLFALPKKTFPKSHSDRFMAFVQKSNASIKQLKDEFFKGSKYETKTQGTRLVDCMTPVAEGVYAITRTEDKTTHLIYSTTIPSSLGEVQEDLGIKDQGSFIVSVKNPKRSGPASASLGQSPGFPKEIIEEFRGLAWSDIKPKYLDYEYCQILLIGEKLEQGVKPTTRDEKHNKETPQEELEKLEYEDELRVRHLSGDDSIFDDLNLSKKEYPAVPTTW